MIDVCARKSTVEPEYWRSPQMKTLQPDMQEAYKDHIHFFADQRDDRVVVVVAVGYCFFTVSYSFPTTLCCPSARNPQVFK
jgi:hypothetical protein